VDDLQHPWPTRSTVEVLQADGRMSIRELAEQAGVSRANAYARLDRLRGEGVIRGFTVQVDHRRLGLPVSALVIISVEQAKWREVADKLLAIPGVDSLVVTTGDFDYVALVRMPDVETLRDVILERLHALPEVKSTRTVFVLDELHPQ
jgi:DNA-binding Lrp family transcriptional regulator